MASEKAEGDEEKAKKKKMETEDGGENKDDTAEDINATNEGDGMSKTQHIYYHNLLNFLTFIINCTLYWICFNLLFYLLFLSTFRQFTKFCHLQEGIQFFLSQRVFVVTVNCYCLTFFLF